MNFIDDNILNGAVDMHIHVGPDYSPRYSDGLRLAKEAEEAGMKAIIIKQHLAPTVTMAYEAGVIYPNVKVFGGVSLNETTGGLSPRCVLATVKSGGKMVWLPTSDAKYAMERSKQGHWIKEYVNGAAFKFQVEPLEILDAQGELKSSVRDILGICKEYGAILGSGHVGPQESLVLAREARKIGYDKLEITHPNAWADDFTIPVCKELAALGATLTISYGVCSPHNGRQDPHEIVQLIREVGAEHCVLITDYGQVASPSPVQGMRVFYYLLARLGIPAEDLNLMMKTNPARLLDL